jgi:hypothetical protein
MKEFSATRSINAAPETVWRIITDAPNYPTWDPGVIRIEGTIAPGETVTAYSKLSPKRAFPAKVTVFEPGKRMTWTGGMPLGLFKGVRTFTLDARPDGSVEFTLRETFSGPLLPLIGRTIPDMTQNFEDFVDGLKQHAEKREAGGK